MFKSTLLAITILFSSTSLVNAQVVINEINPSGEWIELFKTSSGAVTLEGCILYFHSLDNSTSNTQNKELTASDNFLENEIYKVVNSGGNWLNNSSSDTVSLDCPSFDDGPHSYGDNLDTKSYARVPNGTGTFVILTEISQGSANPYPTASPTPSPSSTPTPTPSPTPSPRTPTPTLKPTVKPTKSPTPEAESTPEGTPGGDVLGLREGLKTPTPEPASTSQEEGKKFPLIAGIFIVGGLGFVGAASYPFLKTRFSRYNKKSPNDQNPPTY